MGVLSRFKDIMAANVNALLDKCEDPEKMIEQTLRNLYSNLADVKRETAGVMATEKSAKRALDAKKKEIEEDLAYAKKALQAGNEADATKFLEEKARDEADLVTLTETYNMAHTNAEQMRQMHDKLVSDIETLNSRKAMIKGKMAVAKAQQSVNKATGAVSGKANSSIAQFERMEEKANEALDRAQAMAELNQGTVDSMTDLKAKYSAGMDVSAELAALKAECGLATEHGEDVNADAIDALKKALDAAE